MAANADRLIENPEANDSRTIDVEPLGKVDVEPLGKWKQGVEQGVEQDSSPKVAELAEWLIAAQTLGRGQDEIDHIKRLARESTASTGRSFKLLYQENPQWSNPDYAMPPIDWQKMQSDLTMFAELKRDVGETGVVLLHKRQTSTSEPMSIETSEDLTQVCAEVQETLQERSTRFCLSLADRMERGGDRLILVLTGRTLETSNGSFSRHRSLSGARTLGFKFTIYRAISMQLQSDSPLVSSVPLASYVEVLRGAITKHDRSVSLPGLLCVSHFGGRLR